MTRAPHGARADEAAAARTEVDHPITRAASGRRYALAICHYWVVAGRH